MLFVFGNGKVRISESDTVSHKDSVEGIRSNVKSIVMHYYASDNSFGDGSTLLWSVGMEGVKAYLFDHLIRFWKS